VQKRQLANARETGDRLAQVIGLGNLGRIYRSLGRTEEALTCLTESLQHAHEIGDSLQGLVLQEIIFVYWDQGRFQEAQAHMKQPAGVRLEEYPRWRGHAWSAIFPAFLSLRVGLDAPAPPVRVPGDPLPDVRPASDHGADTAGPVS